MYYKKYYLSQSLNGDKIVWIARNPMGVVVIRESSLEKLKREIDRRDKQEQEAKRNLKAKANKEDNKETTTEKTALEPEKDKEEEEKIRKKSLWDKLIG